MCLLKLSEKKRLAALSSELQLPVMDILWTKGAMKGRDLHEEIRWKKGIAYTTTLTVLERLSKKGLIKKDRTSGTILFTPALSRKAYERAVTEGLVQKAFETSPDLTVSAFADIFSKMPKEDLGRLEKMIEEKKNLEEDPQHLGDGEDDLAMRHVQQERLPHPLAPLLYALSVAGGTEPPGAAGEHNEPLRIAVGTPDAGKTATGVAAVQALLHDLLDDRPEKTILLLKATLKLGKKPVEMMGQHPVENGPLRTPLGPKIHGLESLSTTPRKKENPVFIHDVQLRMFYYRPWI